jgi:hypothetical protein
MFTISSCGREIKTIITINDVASRRMEQQSGGSWARIKIFTSNSLRNAWAFAASYNNLREFVIKVIRYQRNPSLKACFWCVQPLYKSYWPGRECLKNNPCNINHITGDSALLSSTASHTKLLDIVVEVAGFIVPVLWIWLRACLEWILALITDNQIPVIIT